MAESPDVELGRGRLRVRGTARRYKPTCVTASDAITPFDVEATAPS
eukprot:CAMPEP_0183360798 /NCGR_PEP_ID=MMETSP0164_2-20130417/56079_1 /TAXON_ID=221442 /ORGANISM="Coccolithus pelagicus ssp braarudi, Strain PLY182g" /LENGTH=45 /DNA_ID= /DNA_START= /DNA_END= /DNA_ORIENTATION=